MNRKDTEKDTEKRHRKRHRAAIEQQRSKDIVDFLVVGPSKKKLKSRLRSLSAYLLSLTFLNTSAASVVEFLLERASHCKPVPPIPESCCDLARIAHVCETIAIASR